jgi:hypothetical protein
MADVALIVGAIEEQIAAVVMTATTVLTRKLSNKSEATSVTILAPLNLRDRIENSRDA